MKESQGLKTILIKLTWFILTHYFSIESHLYSPKVYHIFSTLILRYLLNIKADSYFEEFMRLEGY